MCCNGRLINTNMVISKLQTFTRQKHQTKAHGLLRHRDRESQGWTRPSQDSATNYITMGKSPTLYNSFPSVVG